jgi:aryl carrier-like protein
METMESTTTPVPADPRPQRLRDLMGLVRRAWQDTLGCETFDDDTGFFDAGGDSFVLLSLVEKLKQFSGLKIRAVDVLRAPTIRRQAALLAQLQGDS